MRRHACSQSTLLKASEVDAPLEKLPPAVVTTGTPSADRAPNLECARSSSAALALFPALSPALPQILALPDANQVQSNGIGGPNRNREQPSKPSALG
jgi:hypothetical protein